MDERTDERTGDGVRGVGWLRLPWDNKGTRTKRECKIKQFCQVNRDLTFCQKKFSGPELLYCAIRFQKLRQGVGKLYIFKINYLVHKERVLLGNSLKVSRSLFQLPTNNAEYFFKCLWRVYVLLVIFIDFE